MSLLGRLEDLSLADIVQIVFLSRRTGMLEIIDERGRHTVLFRNGLVIDAQSPDQPDLITWLRDRGVIAPGSALSEVGSDKLADAVRERIIETVTPLLQSREGQFNFILSSDVSSAELEYDPAALFKDGGLPPQTIFGGEEGARLKPLQGLEDSLKAGRDLRRPAQPPAPALETIEAPLPPMEAPAIADEELVEVERETKPDDAPQRHVIVLERDPLIRVAARRAFTRRGFHVAQFSLVDDAWDAAAELLGTNTFFVSFLEVMENSAAVLQKLKKKNARLPVVMIDTDADLRRRHSLLQMGADLYLTKPSPERMHPAGAEEELDLFADELVLFADRVFAQSEAGSDIDRAFKLLKQLINELSDPNDIHEVGETILHLAAQYLERGALFVIGEGEFVGIGGFGTDVSNLTLARRDDSILNEVATSGEARRGKLQRTPANVELIERLGTAVPTEAVALPIMQGGRAIGILYGDNAKHRVPIDSTAGLEIFLSQAGFALEKAIAAAERSDRG